MELNHILKVTLRKVIQVLRLECGGLFLIDHETKKIKLQARLNIPEAFADKEIIFSDKLLMKHLVKENPDLPPDGSFPSFRIHYPGKDGNKSMPLSCFLTTFKGKATGFFGSEYSTWPCFERS